MSHGDMNVLSEQEVQEVLRDTFYQNKPAPKRKRRSSRVASKPDDYEVICISLYKKDLEQLDTMVRTLKSEGHRKLSRSSLIRFALDHVDVSALPKSY